MTTKNIKSACDKNRPVSSSSSLSSVSLSKDELQIEAVRDAYLQSTLYNCLTEGETVKIGNMMEELQDLQELINVEKKYQCKIDQRIKEIEYLNKLGKLYEAETKAYKGCEILVDSKINDVILNLETEMKNLSVENLRLPETSEEIKSINTTLKEIGSLSEALSTDLSASEIVVPDFSEALQMKLLLEEKSNLCAKKLTELDNLTVYLRALGDGL